MADNAHFRTAYAGKAPTLIVRDDRGATITELELPTTVSEPAQVDSELNAAGWSRSADWTAASDGWLAPVVPA